MALASHLAPLPALLPDGPFKDPFTPAQWDILLALMDTIIPSIQRGPTKVQKATHLVVADAEYDNSIRVVKKVVAGNPDDEALDKYFNEKASDSPQFQALLKRALGQDIPEESRKGLAFVLSTLNTRVGSLMLTGYATPIHEQPVRIREAIIDGWRQSYIPTLNIIHKTVATLGKSLWLRTSPTFRQLCGAPRAPDQYKPGPGFTFDFLQFEPGSETEVIETDVVIVGSGCGGAVCAKNLAEAGNRVLVVDKSYYFRPEQLPLSEETGLNHVLESGGALVSDDGSVSIAAASVWGGGGTVNWSASLQTQNFVRKEWAQDRGLKFFETAEYQSCLDRVCHRMGVSADHIRQNHGNRVLLEGARKLGYHAKAVPQNTGGKEHYCGHCCLGCGSNEKQGPVMTWLPDAANAGAKFVEGFKVDRVLFDKSNTTKAIGIKGVWTSRNSKGGLDGPISERTVRKVVVKAKKVIISSGTLWSPIILLKSGLKNYHIGRNLYLHPVNFVAAVFDEEVKPWEGGILTTVCTSFENLDGHGHGAKLETTAMVPSMFLVYKNWVDGLSWKTDALKIRNMNGFISIARDRDGGRIYPDPNSGSPRIQYTPSTFDRGHCMEGLLALAKMAYVSGATEIHPFLQGLQPFLRDAGDTPSEPAVADEPDPGVTDARFGAWLAEIERIGNKPPTGTFTSAHQMGTNRMSVRARDGVVDPKGKVWGTEGLYVSDASIFPSASGVNPMITNMAISDWISTNIAKEMRYGGLAMESRL